MHLPAKPLVIDFSEEKEDGYRRVFARSPLLTNLSANWNGIYFAYDYQPPSEIPEVCATQHGLAIHIDAPTPIQVERTLDGKFRHEQMVQGDIVIAPASVSTRACWDTAGGVIYLGFEQSVFARHICEEFNPDRAQLVPHFATPDPLVYQMGLALKRMLESEGNTSRLYAETMCNALIVHLLQNYSTRPLRLREVSEGLPRHKLQQVIDYIQAHLERDLGIHELAEVVKISPYYFSRLFKQSTGLTPHQYVIRCRVYRAKVLLLQGNAISEVACRVGFTDQSHLHRHFKRLLGMTPRDILQS